MFQKPPIIGCVGEYNEAGRVPNSILYRTNPEDCTQQAADARPPATDASQLDIQTLGHKITREGRDELLIKC